MKVIIIGGVAGGASCAARLRRLDEQAEILMVERGPYVSFANCGLPYHVGGVIEQESSLLVANEQVFREQFAIDCRTRCEVTAISPADHTVTLLDHTTGQATSRRTTSSCSPPARPPSGHHCRASTCPASSRCARCRTPEPSVSGSSKGTSFLAGMERYSGFQTVRPPRRAVVVGGGLHRPRDGREPRPSRLRRHRAREGQPCPGAAGPRVRAHRRRFPASSGRGGRDRRWRGLLRPGARGHRHRTAESGATYPADIVILAIGVRADTVLARAAGLEVGERGGIRVDEHMRTSDADIFAVGDAVEVRDFVTGQWTSDQPTVYSEYTISMIRGRHSSLAANASPSRSSR